MAAQTKRPTMMQATRASITAVPPEKRSAVPVQVGDAVEVGEQKLTGVVRFMGSTKFAEGEWLGIELDKKAGKNNGSVRGDVYFQCAPDHGIFVRPTAVAKRGGVTSPSAPVVKSAASENAGGVTTPSAPVVKSAATENAGYPSAESLAVPKVEAKSARDSNASKASAEEAVASDRAKAQLDLAMAMEDHDIHRIKHFLPVAKNLGVAPEEINAARKILEYETLVIAAEDVKRLNGSVAELRNRVEDLQKNAQAKQVMPAAVLQELERRLYQSIEAKVTKLLEGRVATLKAKASTSGPAASEDGGKREEIFSGAGRKLTEASKDAEGPKDAAETPLKDVVRSTLFAVFSGASRKLLEEQRFQEDKASDEGKAAKPAAESVVPAETAHSDVVRGTLFAVYSAASRKLAEESISFKDVAVSPTATTATTATRATTALPEAPKEEGKGTAAKPAKSAAPAETPHDDVVRSTLFAVYSSASQKVLEAPKADAGKAAEPAATSAVLAETPHDDVVRSTLFAVYSAAALKSFPLP